MIFEHEEENGGNAKKMFFSSACKSYDLENVADGQILDIAWSRHVVREKEKPTNPVLEFTGQELSRFDISLAPHFSFINKEHALAGLRFEQITHSLSCDCSFTIRSRKNVATCN